MKSRKSIWSEEDSRELAAMVAAGTTPFRAAVRLNRSTSSCQIQARKLGKPFENSKIRRKNILEKCAAAEKALTN
jgi:hypothetical protein